MPEFPRAHSERSLTTRQPRALRNDADVRNEAGDKAKMLGAAADDMSNKLNQWNTYVEKVQEDTALLNYKTGLQEISNRAVQDTNFANKEMYLQEAQDLKQAVTEGIGSNHVKQRMGAELNYMETVGAIGIEGEFRKKTVLHHQAIYTSALDDAARSGNEDEVERLTKQATGSVWNPLEAEKKRIAYSEKARDSKVLQVATENPALAEKMATKGVKREDGTIDSNPFGFKSAKEKSDALKMIMQQRDIVQNQTYIEFTKLKNEDLLKEDVVRDAMDKNTLDPKIGGNMIKDLNTKVKPKPTVDEKIDAYDLLSNMRDELARKEDGPAGFLSKYLVEASFEERANYRAEIFRMSADGLIDPTTLRDEFLTTNNEDLFLKDKTFLNAVEQVNSLSLQYEDKRSQKDSRVNMRRALTAKMKKGMGANQALQEASAERIQADFPEVKASDLLATAYREGIPVWEAYEQRGQGN